MGLLLGQFARRQPPIGHWQLRQPMRGAHRLHRFPTIAEPPRHRFRRPPTLPPPMRQQRWSPALRGIVAPDLRRSRSARISEALSVCGDPRVRPAARASAKLSPAGRSAASRWHDVLPRRIGHAWPVASAGAQVIVQVASRSVAMAAHLLAPCYHQGSDSKAYLRCESARDRASSASRLPGAGESGVPPPPKAQPAPGNAQATGTASGSGISGKPAGSHPPAAPTE